VLDLFRKGPLSCNNGPFLLNRLHDASKRRRISKRSELVISNQPKVVMHQVPHYFFLEGSCLPSQIQNHDYGGLKKPQTLGHAHEILDRQTLCRDCRAQDQRQPRRCVLEGLKEIARTSKRRCRI
jgi:hypothetical protein